MKQLKSLKEFEKESNRMTSEELKNISGGLRQTYTIVTGSDGGDRQDMVQMWVWDGEKYVKDGIAYAQGKPYLWP